MCLPKVIAGEPETRSRSTRDDPETRAHLEAYMQAFLQTEAEQIREFEEASVECWLDVDKR